MHTKEEIKEDLDRLHEYVEALHVKYGPEFSCIIAAGTGMHTKFSTEDTPDAYAGCACVIGEESMLHQACHCLLNSCKFIDSMLDTMGCILLKRHEERNLDKELNLLLVKSMESLKEMLMSCTEEVKKEKEEIEDSVNDLLDSLGLKN
jgi:hypothetical protein